MGRLTLRRVRALYAAWERTPPVAVLAASYLGYKPKAKRQKARGKADFAAFMAEVGAAGGTVTRKTISTKDGG